MDSNDEGNSGQPMDGSQNSVSQQYPIWCPICKTICSDRVMTDTCGHEFCLDCLTQWSAEHNSCPVCRTIYHKIIGSNGVLEEIPVGPPARHFLDTMNQMIHELEELFIQRLQDLRQTISSVEQNLQSLKALVRQMEANWQRTQSRDSGHTLAVSYNGSDDQRMDTETIVESNGFDSLEDNEDISSPKSKKQKRDNDSDEE